MTKDETPLLIVQPDGQVLQVVGLRDWFAGQALQLTQYACDAEMRAEGEHDGCVPSAHAKAAYAIADAMLAERSK